MSAYCWVSQPTNGAWREGEILTETLDHMTTQKIYLRELARQLAGQASAVYPELVSPDGPLYQLRATVLETSFDE